MTTDEALGAETSTPSALHVNDCAFTAERLIYRAHQLGYGWSYLPVAGAGRSFPGIRGHATKAVLGAAWLARLATRSAQVDLLHVHSGSVLRHSRIVPKRYVLHLHGTDIRTLQYDPRWTSVIRNGVRDALAVFYSTPDLAEHTLPLRDDAIYLPVPVDVDRLPVWSPGGGRPTVLFASRWEDAKGLSHQVDVGRRLVRELGADIDVVGMDWGPNAALGAAAGVRLLPRLTHEQFLAALASAHVVVGQSGGILAASELEALGIGVPLVVPVALPLYGDVEPPVVPGGDEDAVDAVQRALSNPQAQPSTRSRAWVAEHHSATKAVETVARTYRDVVG